MQPWNFKGMGKFREGNKSGVINLEFLACHSWIWRERDILCWQERWSRGLLPKQHTGHLAAASDSSKSRAQTPRDSKIHKTQSGHRLSWEGPILWGLSENMRQFYLKAKVGKSDQRVPATKSISAWLPHLNCLSWRLLTTCSTCTHITTQSLHSASLSQVAGCEGAWAGGAWMAGPLGLPASTWSGERLCDAVKNICTSGNSSSVSLLLNSRMFSPDLTAQRHPHLHRESCQIRNQKLFPVQCQCLAAH